MFEVGSFEAKNTLGSLLDRVANGQEVLITRHGRPAARLVAANADPNYIHITPEQRIRARAAMEQLERLREQGREIETFNWDEWKKYRDEGRP